MTFRQKQSLFARLVAKLIQRIDAEGYEVTFGEAWRPDFTAQIYAGWWPVITEDEFRLLHPEKARRIQRFQDQFRAVSGRGVYPTLHNMRLAIDLNLFREGRWLSSGREFQPFGEWWERQHAECRWGGRFADPGHFSMRHQVDGRMLA